MNKENTINMLKENGYNVTDTLIPIVIVRNEREGKKVEKIIKENGYNGSFGWKIINS